MERNKTAHPEPEVVLSPERLKNFLLRKTLHEGRGLQIILSADGTEVLTLDKHNTVIMSEELSSLDD